MDKKKRSFYEKPDLTIIRITKHDIITTSVIDDDGEDRESEFIPMTQPDNKVVI